MSSIFSPAQYWIEYLLQKKNKKKNKKEYLMQKGKCILRKNETNYIAVTCVKAQRQVGQRKEILRKEILIQLSSMIGASSLSTIVDDYRFSISSLFIYRRLILWDFGDKLFASKSPLATFGNIMSMHVENLFSRHSYFISLSSLLLLFCDLKIFSDFVCSNLFG